MCKQLRRERLAVLSQPRYGIVDVQLEVPDHTSGANDAHHRVREREPLGAGLVVQDRYLKLGKVPVDEPALT
ncbi:hypothetical protein Sliba_77900 [Streptomyces nigrescens]|uniref:Uncharacterized protein n=1 Tax=Streptomyces nigrescens TaxID=1920 RepID=A0A640TUJ7_STRNI|nr:hypothetical protein Sliba_77900 [Streptomyces libani subsp. libani]GGV96425.1 hypothetical protein GCM10010500_39170 [Streptomyces libani subsp. libani]